MKWLFNDKYYSGEYSSQITYTLDQSRMFRGEQGDEVVFFHYGYRQSVFTYYYKIVSIKNISSGSQTEKRNEKPFYRFEIFMEKIKEYEKKEFEDYVYSFPRIKYFTSGLHRHFNLKYYRLSEPEFNAIDKDEIFESRTVLGVALNAMHQHHRIAFTNFLVREYPEVIQNIYDYARILKLFKEYFDSAIMRPARQLNEGFRFLSKISEVVNREPVGFGNDEKPASRLMDISRQNRVIDSQIGLYLETISLVDPDNLKTKERDFQRLFNGKSLPFNLKEN